MLVLGRRRGERVQVGENIFLRILEIKYNWVKLGFEAPQEVNIRREEVLPLTSTIKSMRSNFVGII